MKQSNDRVPHCARTINATNPFINHPKGQWKMCSLLMLLLVVQLPSSLGLASMTMKMKKSLSVMEAESKLYDRGFQYVLGSDESGNGCIAGPVVVATCTLLHPEDCPILEEVQDSKSLSSEGRREVYQHVLDHPEWYAWNTVLASPKDIDEINVIKASKVAVKNSVEALVAEHNLPIEETYSIVDGYKSPKLSNGVPCRPWVKGDAQVYTVALASIMARVTHEKLMEEYGKEFPEYGFGNNNGYPTQDHVGAIHAHGPSPIHRMSTKPLKHRGTR